MHTKIATFDIDDIFSIDNPEFEKYIPDIYPAELHFNKANTSDKETSFLDLHIKVIGRDIHTSVYDKRDAFGFPIQWYEPRDVRVKVKSSKGNPGSTDLISDRLCDMVWI